ncbi:MAG: methionine synthase [Alphaproteobacteria bacterium]|nr:methionine synthase [Alphaproteobacteria bacterium]
MKRSDERFLVTHMGSLPRGPVLTEMLLEQDKGGWPDPAAFQAAVDEATHAVVTAQAKAGIDVANDGEMPRISFSTYVARRMHGYGGASDRPITLDMKNFPIWRQWVADHNLRRARLWDAPQAQGEIAYDGEAQLAQECNAFERAFAETFMTAASPGIVATTMLNAHYDSYDAYLTALSCELKKEYDAIVARGYLLQIDAPDLAMERATFFQGHTLAEFQGFVARHIVAINEATADIPRGKIRLHACWGNRNSPHVHDVACADVLPLMVEARVGAICLPFANPRHAHEVEVLSTSGLPPDMLVIPGLIDTTTNYVEHPEWVAERLERVVAAVGDRERVLAGTDCGFSTLAGDAFVAEDVVWAKLAALSEGAAIASKRMWGRV